MRFRLSIIFGIFGIGCWQICRQTMAVLLHMCSGFPAQILEQMIVTSLHDITRFSHATEGGNYKREHDQALGLLLSLSSGCFYKCLGLH